MKHLKYIALLLVFVSCRKDVTLVLPEYKQRVVIEGGIETGSTAIVFLSYSVPYFGDFDYSAPEKAFISGAQVVVTDGIEYDTLVQVDPNGGYLYVGTKIKGENNKTYTIKVTVDGKTFETSTSILTPPKLDSLYFKAERDSLGFMWQRFSEPEGTGDCYRWFAKRLNRDAFYAPPFNSVFDDKFIDGKSFEFAYDRGPQPNSLQQNREDPERGYYKTGDTVIVKFCKIGLREYDFWYTYYQNKSSNGNPFSAPSNIKSMFGNYEDAFGAFVGYAPLFDTIIIPKK
ncbi:MAG: DUF4249 domain-containing protein [Bacteroidia bacterium]|nr:DUF4249 domain-containing protein [Bacteroidia bacterium]